MFVDSPGTRIGTPHITFSAPTAEKHIQEIWWNNQDDIENLADLSNVFVFRVYYKILHAKVWSYEPQTDSICIYIKVNINKFYVYV